MTRLMEGKAGFVTGAGAGIGRASAIAFAEEGAKVIISDVNEENGQETARIIKEYGGSATFFKCDVSKEEEVKELVDYTIKEYGRLDWAHNNAGISPPNAKIGELNTADWENTIKINLDGMYYALKFEVQAMLKSGGGTIVNTSSTSSFSSTPGMAAYSTSKWGINGITQMAAMEYGKHGIRVNAICPGMTLTPGVKQWAKENPEQADAVRNTIPLGKLGKPEDQANAAVWLCSEKAAFITGVTLPIDGGRILQ